MRGVSKRYGGVRALQDAELVIEAGRIHAVLGENGAGKSTLMKILGGVVEPSEGVIRIDGAERGLALPEVAVAPALLSQLLDLAVEARLLDPALLA